ncbi:MAG TPA: hypothetical protein VNZ64_25775 [Candidatus Acidoferrum sp.]|nr:hypothetical protein [Candidatus Acidoferrum sp.]
MNAYLFNAGVGRSQNHPTRGLQTWDSCESAILYGGDVDQAQKKFEGWCRSSPDQENPVGTVIKRVVAAQFIEELLTESGSRTLDWREMSHRVMETVPATAVDDFEQGYWVDVNQAVPPGKIGFDVDAVKRDLAEDIWSGLNWSPTKTFLFLVSVLSSPPTPADPDAEFESGETDSNEADEDGAGEAVPDLDAVIASLPEMREKEAAALVEARNSVVAGWLWRKFAAETRLAANEIQVGQCCGIFAME